MPALFKQLNHNNLVPNIFFGLLSCHWLLWTHIKIEEMEKVIKTETGGCVLSVELSHCFIAYSSCSKAAE